MTVLIDRSPNKAAKLAAIPENYVPHPTSEAWSRKAVDALFGLPFMDLILKSESLAATAIALMLNFHKGLFNPLDGPEDLL